MNTEYIDMQHLAACSMQHADHADADAALKGQKVGKLCTRGISAIGTGTGKEVLNLNYKLELDLNSVVKCI